ncbi:MAG: amidoligase family protein [Bacteroidales bacterium]
MYKIPPLRNNADNKIRKVGFEIEFSGIETREAANIVKSVYGGEIREKNRYYLKLKDTEIGDFTIKIDSSFLYQKKYSEILEKLGIDNIKDLDEEKMYDHIEEILENIASGFVPHEIVTPPVSLDHLATFDELVKKMNAQKAEGTGSSVIYAFATHINPEAPSLEVRSILSYLRAFFLLYEWLYEELNIDFTRKLTSFINPFSKKYIQKILDPEYTPEMKTFIHDYIEFNPERNRPLDLYPLLSYIEPKVKELEETGIVKPRPTYHYRLPNSEIDQKDWNFSNEWNYWWYVEKLASEKESINNLSKIYLDIYDKILTNSKNDWLEKIGDWVKQTNK